MTDKPTVVFYHAECQDGSAAAYVFWKRFGETAEYVPINHKDPLPELKDKEIYFLDIAPGATDLKFMLAANKRVVILDHHVTKETDIKGASEYRYGVDKSGAGLTWEYFFATEPLPFLLACVQEGDLWLFKTPHVQEILAVVDLLPADDFTEWDKLVSEAETEAGRKTIIDHGTVILKFRDRIIDKVIRSAHPVIFEGVRTLAINANLLRSMISILGNRLAKEVMPPMAIIWAIKHDRIAVSLRGDGTVDVAKMAERYGGGGHKNAAAFSLPLNSILPWKHDHS